MDTRTPSDAIDRTTALDHFMLLDLWFRSGTMGEFEYSERDRVLSAALNRELGEDFDGKWEQRRRYVPGERGSKISYFPDDPVEGLITVATKTPLVSIQWQAVNKVLERFEITIGKTELGPGQAPRQGNVFYVPSAFQRTYLEAVAVAQNTGSCPDGTDVFKNAVRAMFPQRRPPTEESVYEVEKGSENVIALVLQLDPRTWTFVTKDQARAIADGATSKPAGCLVWLVTLPLAVLRGFFQG